MNYDYSTQSSRMNPTEATTSIVSEMHKVITIQEEQISMEPDKVDLVAGSKRSNKKRLEEIYGVDIILPAIGGSEIVIRGPADMVSAAKKEIEESISFETRFFIEKEFARLVIGPKGERADYIRRMSDVRIMDINKEGHVKLCGKKNACEAAKEAIESIINLATIVSFFVEKGYYDVIIGRGGECVRSLEKAHSVTIDLNQEDGKVLVVGKKSGCEACKKTIESMIEEKKVIQPMEKLYIPGHLLGSVVGTNGQNVNRIKSTYKVQVSTSRINKEQADIWVKGASTEDVYNAMKDVVDNLPWKLRKDLDKSSFESINGRGGENVQRLSREYGVRIELKDGKVVILGKKVRVEAAREAIDSILYVKR